MGKTKRYWAEDDNEKRVKNHYRRNKKKFHIADIEQLENIEEQDEFEDDYFKNFSKIKKRGT